jgi:hypothetical protein
MMHCVGQDLGLSCFVLPQAAQECPGLAGELRQRAREERAAAGEKPVHGFQQLAMLSQQVLQSAEEPRS